MKEVTKEEYEGFIGDKDLVLSVVGDYPYTTEWKWRGSGKMVAKSVEELNGNTKYYIDEVDYRKN